MRLSPSQLRIFDQCRARWRWLYYDKADKDPGEEAPAYRFGKAVHAALEDVFSWIKTEEYYGPAHTPGLLDLARTRLNQQLDEHGVDHPEERQQADEMVIDYLLDQHHVAGKDILGVEVWLTFNLGDHKIVGKADRVDRIRHGGNQGIRIIDYKAGTWVPDPDELRNDLQAQTYVIAGADRFGDWPRRIEFQIDSLGARDRVRISFTRHDVDYMKRSYARLVGDRATLMDGGPWRPTEGWWCDRCEFASRCPAKGGTPSEDMHDPRQEDLIT